MGSDDLLATEIMKGRVYKRDDIKKLTQHGEVS